MHEHISHEATIRLADIISNDRIKTPESCDTQTERECDGIKGIKRRKWKGKMQSKMKPNGKSRGGKQRVEQRERLRVGGGERSSLTKQDEHVMKQQRPA